MLYEVITRRRIQNIRERLGVPPEEDQARAGLGDVEDLSLAVRVTTAEQDEHAVVAELAQQVLQRRYAIVQRLQKQADLLADEAADAQQDTCGTLAAERRNARSCKFVAREVRVYSPPA